jgi:hypothetical protein
MLARRLVRHSLTVDGGSLGEGGSIARRPSPGRNCRRARCAAVAFHAVELLTPPPPEPDADLNAKQQRPKAAKQITNDKFSMTNSQWILSHECGEVSKKKAMAFAFSAPSTPARYAGLGVWSPSSRLFSSLSSFLVPSFPWPLPAYAPVHQRLVLSAQSQSTAVAPGTTFQLFPLFSSFSTLIPALRQRGRNTQPIAPTPLATGMTASPLAHLINFETLILILPGFYERQAPISCPSTVQRSSPRAPRRHLSAMPKILKNPGNCCYLRPLATRREWSASPPNPGLDTSECSFMLTG